MAIDFQPIQSTIDFQPLQDDTTMSAGNYQPASPPPENQSLAEKIVNYELPQNIPVVGGQSPVKTINALGGGIQQGLANTVGTAVGSPATAQVLSPPDIVKQDMTDNPTTATAGNLIGSIAPAVGATIATGGALAPLLGEGIINAVVANSLVGSVLAGPEHRGMGAVIGGGTALLAPIVTSTANYLVKASSIGTKVKQVVGQISSQIKGMPDKVAAQSQANMWNTANAVENKLFTEFRNVPGKVDGGYIAAKAATFLNDHLDELSPTQRSAIQNYIMNSAKATNLAELHDARKAFAFDYNKFDKLNVSQKVYSGFRSLINESDFVLKNNAEVLGVGQQFNLANRYYKDTVLPLINTGAKETAEALDAATMAKAPLDAAKITDGLINRYIKNSTPEQAKTFLNTLDDTGRKAVEVQMINNALKTATSKTGDVDYVALKTAINNINQSHGSIFSEPTKKILAGLNNTIDEATTIGGMTLDLAKIGPTSKVYAAGAGLGMLGYAAGGPAAIGAGLSLVGISKLLGTPTGQNLLIKAGSEGGKRIGKAIVEGIMMQETINRMDGEANAN